MHPTTVWFFFINYSSFAVKNVGNAIAAVLVTSLFQTYILSAYTDQYMMGLLSILLTLALVLLYRGGPFSKQLAIISICALLLAPAYWSATPIFYGGNSVLPESGPRDGNSSMLYEIN